MGVATAVTPTARCPAPRFRFREFVPSKSGRDDFLNQSVTLFAAKTEKDYVELMSYLTLTRNVLLATVLTLLFNGPCEAAQKNVDTVRAASAALEKEIAAWKRGDEVPHRLLSFPEGNVDPAFMLQSDAYEDVFTPRWIIHDIHNVDLLKAIFFDRRSEHGALQYAAMALIDLKGLPWFANMLTSEGSTRWEHDALRDILRRSFIKTDIARVCSADMPKDEGQRTMEDLRKRLDAGESWKSAYGAIADAHPDLADRKKDPTSTRTLVGYRYSGWISETGFDISSLQISPYAPTQYLAEAIRSGKGGRIIDGADGVYLIYVYETYSPAPLQQFH